MGLVLNITAYGDNWYNTKFKTKQGTCIKGPKTPKGWTPIQLKKTGFSVTKIKKHLYQVELNGNMMFLTKTHSECKEFLNGFRDYRKNK
jgi:hypothetical protein